MEVLDQQWIPGYRQGDEPLGLREGLEAFATIFMPARNYSERTRREYHDDVADLVRFLEARGIGTWSVVGLSDLRHYLAELDYRRLAASSRNRKTYAIKTFFKFLYQDGYIKHDPARELIPPPVPQKDRRYLSEIEYKTLLSQVSDDRDRAILELFLQTGLRISELVRLTVNDLDLPENINQEPENVGFLRVWRKGTPETMIPLNWKACETLSVWLKEREALVTNLSPTPTALFISKRHKPLSRKAIYNLVKKYLVQAGIHDASVHTLRHTMAVHYLAKGGDLKSVQELLGHESPETTRIYVELARRVQRRMVQELAL